MEKEHSEEPNYLFQIRCLLITISKAYQVAITSWKNKLHVTNFISVTHHWTLAAAKPVTLQKPSVIQQTNFSHQNHPHPCLT